MSDTRWDVHRRIKERWIIEGTLELESPAHFGNGDVSMATDMPLACDAATGRPLLTGASIAGALRHYLHTIDPGRANRLFGEVRTTPRKDNDLQSLVVESAVIVYDALAKDSENIELRDGVSIDPKTRTAEAKKKYDIELLPAATQFDLCFELAISGEENELIEDLALILDALEQGRIGLGKRKTRGFGHCKVTHWRVCRYQITQPKHLIAWINEDRSEQKSGKAILELIRQHGINLNLSPYLHQAEFSLSATFRLQGSLLIRSPGLSSNAPDIVHLHSERKDGLQPVLSGTSLAGALRGRALRIANTLAGQNRVRADALIDSMFGPRAAKQLWASRVRVKESVIQNALTDHIQNRVKIDRFTGGASSTALFSEQPVFALPETRLKTQIELVKAGHQQKIDRAEVGLLLLLLKDLWTGDLPLGGETSVGRGRLQGVSAELWLEGKQWKIHNQDGKLLIDGNQDELEKCVQELIGRLQNA